MKKSRIMRERIKRIRILLTELGYLVHEGELEDGGFSAIFEDTSGFKAVYYIDRDNKFLEIGFTFGFSANCMEHIRNSIEEIHSICYEFGCYFNMYPDKEIFSISVYSKIYFAGLNYYALKETLKDFTACVDMLKSILTLCRKGG